MPNNPDLGVRVDFSQAEFLRFEKDVKRFVSEFGEKKLETVLRRNVTKIPFREAKAILTAKTSGTGKLAESGLLVAKERNSGATASMLIGGGRAKKHEHGFMAHWVELGTSGIVRDGGNRYKSGTRYRAPQRGIHFLERSAEGTKDELFGAVQKSFDRAFKKLGK
jgi:hypothetical protein